jgi:hypothetical protein
MIKFSWDQQKQHRKNLDVYCLFQFVHLYEFVVVNNITTETPFVFLAKATLFCQPLCVRGFRFKKLVIFVAY